MRSGTSRPNPGRDTTSPFRNRLRMRSVPANRLRPGVLGRQITGPLTGADIDEGSLGTVPSAVHAQSADTARSAIDAETALNAVNAVDAQTVNGFGAGCAAGTRLFAGACWDASAAVPCSTTCWHRRRPT